MIIVVQYSKIAFYENNLKQTSIHLVIFGFHTIKNIFYFIFTMFYSFSRLSSQNCKILEVTENNQVIMNVSSKSLVGCTLGRAVMIIIAVRLMRVFTPIYVPTFFTPTYLRLPLGAPF